MPQFLILGISLTVYTQFQSTLSVLNYCLHFYTHTEKSPSAVIRKNNYGSNHVIYFWSLSRIKSDVRKPEWYILTILTPHGAKKRVKNSLWWAWPPQFYKSFSQARKIFCPSSVLMKMVPSLSVTATVFLALIDKSVFLQLVTLFIQSQSLIQIVVYSFNFAV